MSFRFLFLVCGCAALAQGISSAQSHDPADAGPKSFRDRSFEKRELLRPAGGSQRTDGKHPDEQPTHRPVPDPNNAYGPKTATLKYPSIADRSRSSPNASTHPGEVPTAADQATIPSKNLRILADSRHSAASAKNGAAKPPIKQQITQPVWTLHAGPPTAASFGAGHNRDPGQPVIGGAWIPNPKNTAAIDGTLIRRKP